MAQGRVALRGSAGADSVVLTLRPRDRGVIDAHGRSTVTSGVRLETYLAWIGGTLVFDDAPLGSVVAELERWYDVDIELDPSLANERLTISFATESAPDALAALATVLNVRSTWTGRSVRLSPVPPED